MSQPSHNLTHLCLPPLQHCLTALHSLPRFTPTELPPYFLHLLFPFPLSWSGFSLFLPLYFLFLLPLPTFSLFLLPLPAFSLFLLPLLIPLLPSFTFSFLVSLFFLFLSPLSVFPSSYFLCFLPSSFLNLLFPLLPSLFLYLFLPFLWFKILSWGECRGISQTLLSFHSV